MDQKEIKKFLKKVWHFIWEDDSVWSWIVNIILAFILIKFVVYPGLGFILSTSYPIVAVVSGSMEHNGNFDTWWDSYALCNNKECTQSVSYQAFNITKQDFLEFRFKNGFNKGDIMILRGTSPEKINVGDIIVFQSTRPDPIIHRIVMKWEQDSTVYFQTKGDHNPTSYPSLKEDEINENRVIGKAVAKVPFLGWIKIAAVNMWTIARPR
ncbi:signal peptidase I [Candidatus Woesearchaeota archaeon]|nr:signal peptidase I [Candidatus Woesearchaeota archaeon]